MGEVTKELANELKPLFERGETLIDSEEEKARFLKEARILFSVEIRWGHSAGRDYWLRAGHTEFITSCATSLSRQDAIGRAIWWLDRKPYFQSEFFKTHRSELLQHPGVPLIRRGLI